MTTSFKTYGLWFCAGLLCLVSAVANADATLVPPPGWREPVIHKNSNYPCEPPPQPFTGDLNFPSKYEGSGPARNVVNPQAYARYQQMIAPINSMEKNVSSMVSHYLHSGQQDQLECALNWLTTWSDAGALEGEAKDFSGKAVRKWTLASLASAYVRLKFSPSNPLAAEADKTGKIEAWLGQIGEHVVDDWKDRPVEKYNNHQYWAAWAVMADAVALNRRDFFDWSVSQYRTAAGQVDSDGYLPNELKRQTRALSYHDYALGPLAMMAAFGKANGVDLASEGNGALQRLATRTLAGVDDPGIFEQKTGSKQDLEGVEGSTKFAWMEPYCWTIGCDAALTKRMASLRPMKSYRLGGNVTELFNPGWKADKDTDSAQ